MGQDAEQEWGRGGTGLLLGGLGALSTAETGTVLVRVGWEWDGDEDGDRDRDGMEIGKGAQGQTEMGVGQEGSKMAGWEVRGMGMRA